MNIDDTMYRHTVAQRDAAWREIRLWQQRYDALLKSMTDSLSLRSNPPMKLLTHAESFEAGRVLEREAMVALAAKQGWVMKNEDPFEDAVREIATISARGQA